MRKIYIISTIFLSIFNQDTKAQTKTTGVAPLAKEINFSDTSIKDFAPSLNSNEMQPIPASDYGNKKEVLYKKRMGKLNAPKPSKKNGNGDYAVNPTLLYQDSANVANSVPNDNDIAISLDGMVISAVNSNIQVRNSSGTVIANKSLQSLASVFGNYTFNSDPRLLYDPQTDRFILVWFTGSLSTTNKIFIGFSKTSDPSGNWNMYQLDGSPFDDSTWSDYPILAISDNDLFMTFNLVKDNVGWQNGFKQSVIWQIDKAYGFNGDSIKYNLWSDIKYNNGYLRNICPAKNQSGNMNDNMYFLSVRNVDYENDSIFILEITDAYETGNAQMKQKLTKSPIKYGFPPNAIQGKASGVSQQLMTNDARVLAAIYENDYVHFGLNTVLPTNTTATVLLGSIANISSSQPTVSAKLLDESNLEFGYPSMAYVGNDVTDHSVLFTFSHCEINGFPGTSVMYKDPQNNFSKLNRLKNGTSIINRLADSVERWGDYTNVQKLFDKNNQVYLAGSFGSSNLMKTYIAKLEINDTVKAIDTSHNSSSILNSNQNEFSMFPIPIHDNRFTVAFNLKNEENLLFELLDIQGKLISKLLETKGHKGKNEFSIRTNDLSKGRYYIHIIGDKTYQLTEKLLIE